VAVFTGPVLPVLTGAGVLIPPLVPGPLAGASGVPVAVAAPVVVPVFFFELL